MAEVNAATGGEQTDARGGWDDFVVIDLHADGRVTASGDGARNAQDSSSDGGDAAPASSNSQPPSPTRYPQSPRISASHTRTPGSHHSYYGRRLFHYADDQCEGNVYITNEDL